jgi:hypothetical protein
MAFLTLTPTKSGNQFVAHCEDCGHFSPLGIDMAAGPEVAAQFTSAWEESHTCSDIDADGLLMHASQEEINQAFGLLD